jgi:hypothetical protein
MIAARHGANFYYAASTRSGRRMEIHIRNFEMPGSDATFEVGRIFELKSLSGIVLRGHIKTGVVVSGMIAKVWVDGGLYMAAPIKSVEYIDGPGIEGMVGLVLEAPDNDVRELWLSLCKVGDVLSIEVPKQNQPDNPTVQLD